MASDWSDLMRLTGGEPFVIERVRLSGSGIAVEGEFEPPPLAVLSLEDQVFVAAFIKSHGSIKEMERLFGVSYPTVKNRLARISAALGFMELKATPDRIETLDRLARGEISVDAAVEDLRQS